MSTEGRKDKQSTLYIKPVATLASSNKEINRGGNSIGSDEFWWQKWCLVEIADRCGFCPNHDPPTVCA